jgi:hypothetical protein
MLQVAVLAIIFLIRLRLKQNVDVLTYVRNRYGENGYRTLRNLENTARKLEKNKLDLEFLTKCKVYNVFPKFLRFKLYKRALHTSKFYKSWQCKLLSNEISFKKRTITSLSDKLLQCHAEIKSSFTFLDSSLVRYFLIRQIDEFRASTLRIHDRKLSDLGIYNALQPCDPDKVIHNYSSVLVPHRIKILLSFGLDFCLPVYRLDFYKYFLSFERLYSSLARDCTVALSPSKLTELRDRVHALSFKYFYGFKGCKIFSSVISRDDVFQLKKFSADSNIVVCKPDKVRG